MSRGCRDSRWPFRFSEPHQGWAAVKVIRVVPCGRIRVERFRLVRQSRQAVPLCALRPACLHDPDTLHSNASAKPPMEMGARSRSACPKLASTPALAGAGKLRMGGVGEASHETNRQKREFNADDQPAGPQGPHAAEGQVEGPCDGAEPAEARRLHARLHDDPEEAELGSAQGGQGSPDQPARSHQLHSG